MAFTFFFRDMQTLKLIPEYVLPRFDGRMAIRIWDAGCAMGPEPFSLAIVLRETLRPALFQRTRIYATDLDPHEHFGEIVREGVFPEEQVKRVPEDVRKRYFAPADKADHVQILNELRAQVMFVKHDLLSLTAPLDQPVELVLCKNVLLHFSDSQRCDVIRMFHAALTSGGYLVMEHTQAVPDGVASLFDQVTAHARLYRKVG